MTTFQKLNAFSKKVTDLTDVPSENLSPAQIKSYFDTPDEELMTTLNNVVDGLNGSGWVDTSRLAPKAVTRDKVVAGAIGTNELDPVILNQPTTEIGQQAKFASIDVSLADKTKHYVNISEYPRLVAETNDNARIKRALDYLKTKGGGILQFNDYEEYSIKGHDDSYPTGSAIHDATKNFSGGIDVPSNIAIFMRNATFRILNNTSESYVCFHIYDKENILLDGGNIIGDKSTHTGLGEYGHGITVFNSKNVIILNTTINDTWGDGVYIGIKFNNTTTRQSENIYLHKVTVDNTSRNGFSIGSGNGVTLQDCISKRVTRTNPKSGLDIEPEGYGTSGVLMEKIRINNFISDSCNYGIYVYLSDISNAGDLFVDIEINHHTDYGSSVGSVLQRGSTTKKITGLVKYNKPTYYRNQNNGIEILDWAKLRSPLFEVDTPTVYENNRVGSTVDNPTGWAERASIYVSSQLATAEDVGGITIKNPSIIDNNAIKTIFPAVYLKGSPTSKIDDVSIIDPEKLDVPNQRYMTITDAKKIQFTDRKQVMIYDGTWESVTLSIHGMSVFDDKNATNYFIIAMALGVEDGREITFMQSKTRFDIDLRNGAGPKINIFPLTNNHSYLQGTTKGGRLKVKKINGEWFVQEMIGTWTTIV